MNPESTRCSPNNATFVWSGFCCECSAPITRANTPPPCHYKRMRCSNCRKAIRIRARATWILKNPEAERKHRRKAGRKNTEKRREKSRNFAENTGGKWSGDEEHFLLKSINKLTQLEIAVILGRSLSSIQMKIWRLRSTHEAPLA